MIIKVILRTDCHQQTIIARAHRVVIPILIIANHTTRLKDAHRDTPCDIVVKIGSVQDIQQPGLVLRIAGSEKVDKFQNLIQIHLTVAEDSGQHHAGEGRIQCGRRQHISRGGEQVGELKRLSHHACKTFGSVDGILPHLAHRQLEVERYRGTRE